MTYSKHNLDRNLTTTDPAAFGAIRRRLLQQVRANQLLTAELGFVPIPKH